MSKAWTTDLVKWGQCRVYLTFETFKEGNTREQIPASKPALMKKKLCNMFNQLMVTM